MIKFCVSLTTLPSRINNIEHTLNSINRQTLQPDKIFINLPYKFRRFKNIEFSNDQIIKLQQKKVEVLRCDDYGPGTKLLGSIKKIRNNYDCVILIDDDHIYHEKTFEIFINNFIKKRINYSFYLNKIFNIYFGQGADGFLIDVNLLNEIENFYERYVKNNNNLFLDDDLWISIYLYCEKKSEIKNLIENFRNETKHKIIYTQTLNKDIDALHKTKFSSKNLLSRRKIQKIEYIKYKLKKIFHI